MVEAVAADRSLTMRAVSLHGVNVAWDVRDGLDDPLSWLAVFPESTDPPALTVRLARRSSESVPHRGAPWFFHGVLQASREHELTLLDDGASRAEIRRGEVRVELALQDGRPGAFAAGLVGAAVLLALRDQGLFDLHAAAVVDVAGRGILVAGDSGAGKTTTTLALLENGASYVSDDRVLLRAEGGDVAVLSWPREFHVGAATLAAFPRLAALVGAPYGAGDKVTLDPTRAFADRFRAALPRVDALVFPRIDPNAETTAAVPVDRATAFGELLIAGAMALLDGVVGGADHLDLLRRIADRGVGFELTLGRDALRDPAVVARTLERAMAVPR